MTTIFYIEDSPVEQLYVQKILQPYYTVVVANNGLDALQNSKGSPPDLVLTDLNMPGLDGYEIATRLKSTWPTTPIIALTGDHTNEARQMALIAGCDGWLTKPIAPNSLLTAIQRHLNGYTETLPDSPHLADQKLAYQRRLVSRLETQVTALTQANNQLTALQKISQAISASLNTEEIINNALFYLETLLNFEHLAIFLYDPTQQTLSLAGQRNFPSPYLDFITRPYYCQYLPTFIKQAIVTNTSQFVNNLPEHPDIQAANLSNTLNYITRLVTVPLSINNRVIGLLQVGSIHNQQFFANSHSILELISRQLATVIDKAKIHTDLNVAYKKLQQLDDLKNHFIMIASHELRTPLTLLMGYTFLLQKETESENHEILSMIIEQADVLKILLDRILDVERLQNQDFWVDFVDVDLNTTISHLVNKLQPLANAQQVNLSFVSTGTTEVVKLDLLKTEAILSNLIANGLQFTPLDGLVTVVAKIFPSHFEIHVTDTGIGIPSEEHQRIFDKFYQVDRSLKRTHNGVGLGLTIAREMATLCNGSITLVSTPGQGSTFTYRQPR